jgi:hypothetical protein
MNQSEYQNLNKRRWRALTYNFEALSTYGNSYKLYCLTDFQVGWILSNTEYMSWKSRWSNFSGTQQQLRDMTAELDYALMNCVDLYGTLDYLTEVAQDQKFAEYNALYDAGGISELNPATPTDFYSGDDSFNRLNALCMACDTYVRSYLNRWLTIARAGQTALIFAGTAVSFVPYIGKIAAVALKSLSLLTQVAIDAVSDDSAIQDVVCCMYNGLVSQAVNESGFENSLSSCGFEVGSNSAIVRDLISADLDVFNNWLTFLNALGDCYVWLQAGVEYVCPCVIDTPFCIRINFDSPDGVVTSYCGVPTGQQLDYQTTLCSGAYFARIAFSVPEFTITSLRMDYTLSGSNPAFRAVMQVQYAGGLVELQDVNPAVAGNFSLFWDNPSGQQADTFLLYVRVGTTVNPPTGDTGRLNYVEITGKNFNPFSNGLPC